MAFSLSNSSDDEDEIQSTINTTPLVDVMLVLLVIFLITVPVVTHSVQVELPKERNHAQLTKPEDINISVAKNGGIYYNEMKLANTTALLDKLKLVAVVKPQPAVQIRGDGNAAYESVGRVVLTAQRAGIQKIGFITEPPPKG
jgi:biopolymer transport protein ExbD